MARGRASFVPPRALKLFELCVSGEAISHQARGPKGKARLHAWQATVSEASRRSFSAELLAENLTVHLCEFSAAASRDRDNMAKPILDAMQGIIFADDRQVRRLIVDWCDIDGSYVVRSMSPILAEAMIAGHHFIWIRVFAHEPLRALNER